MSQSTGTGGRHGYATALADLWYGLARTLRRLEGHAADLDEDAGEELPALQYALHVAGERIAGLEPPPGAAGAHGELAAALAEARDATAEVADAFAHGGVQAASPLVWEWRGALFAVRLARRRLDQAPDRAPVGPVVTGPRRRSEAVVVAVLALPLLAVVAIAAAVGAQTWAIVAALAVAVAVALLLRRA
ncbi:MAG TPA: hypothetical protein VGJ25_15080 [Gaiellaceae bacterium]